MAKNKKIRIRVFRSNSEETCPLSVRWKEMTMEEFTKAVEHPLVDKFFPSIHRTEDTRFPDLYDWDKGYINTLHA